MSILLNSILLILIIYYSINSLISLIKSTPSVTLKIYYLLVAIVHFSASMLFMYLNDTIGKDAFRYFNGALEATSWFQLLDVGRTFMSFLIYPFVQLGITIEVLFLVFATISFKGVLLYFEMLSIKRITKHNWFVLLLFLMPSLHFWIGFLGKEALLFFLMAYILKEMKAKSFNFPFFLAFLIIFFIRPHVFFIVALGFLIVLLLEKEISKKTKRYLILIPSIIIIALTPIFLKYFLKIDTIDIAGIKEYLSSFLNYTQTNTGNSPISLIDTNLFSRILILLFMPLPYIYAIKNSFQWGIALENVYFLLIFVYSIYCLAVNRIKMNITRMDIKFALITSVLLVVLFGSYIYNLGLASRMRVMFLPYLLYVLIIAFNSVKNNSLLKKG